MRQSHRRFLLILPSVAVTAVVSAQQGPAPRPLGPIVARAAMTFGPIGSIEVVRGSVFVNDMGSRQLLFLDSTLTRSRVVLDSSLSRDNSYGRIGEVWGLRRFRGDSVFMIPDRAESIVVIGPTGTVARIAAQPHVPDFFCVFLSMDDRGRLTCQVPTGPAFRAAQSARRSLGARAADTTLKSPDSSIVVGIYIDSHRVDTIASIAVDIDRVRIESSATLPAAMRALPPSGIIPPRTRPIVAPPGPGDQWVTLRDGTIAVARAAEYRIDFIAPNGTRLNGPRIPFPWRRITDADRVAFADSVVRDDSVRTVASDRLFDSLRAAGGRMTSRGLVSVARPVRLPPLMLASDEWPTFWPPFVDNTSVRNTFLPDADGHVWVQERQPLGGDTVNVFAIIDRRGMFVDRVKVPDNYVLQGFGPGGAVYFTTLDGGRSTLLRMRWTK